MNAEDDGHTSARVRSRRSKVRRQEDGVSNRGEMRAAIARWTPEGRMYFDNRYHQRRCYRLSYRPAPRAVNRQQIGRRARAHTARVRSSKGRPPVTAPQPQPVALHHPHPPPAVPHLSFSCRARFQAIAQLLYRKGLIPEKKRASGRRRGGELSH